MNELMNDIEAPILADIREFADEFGGTVAKVVGNDYDYLPLSIADDGGKWHLESCQRVRGDLVATYVFSGR